MVDNVQIPRDLQRDLLAWRNVARIECVLEAVMDDAPAFAKPRCGRAVPAEGVSVLGHAVVNYTAASTSGCRALGVCTVFGPARQAPDRCRDGGLFVGVGDLRAAKARGALDVGDIADTVAALVAVERCRALLNRIVNTGSAAQMADGAVIKNVGSAS